MRKIILLIILAVLLGGCNTYQKLRESGKVQDLFGEEGIPIGVLSAKRGIVVNFVENKPPGKIEGGRFYIGLHFENYLPRELESYVYLLPTKRIESDLDSRAGVKGSVVVAGAVYNVDDEQKSEELNYDYAKFVRKGTKLATSFDLDQAGDVSLGPYFVKLKYANEEKFRLYLEYTYNVDERITGKLCLANPSVKNFRCPERLGETSFSGPARQMPITVTKIDKQILGVKENYYEVDLKFHIENKGQGNITEKGIMFNADLKNYEIGLRCQSDQSKDNRDKNVYESLPLTLELKEGKAVVSCKGRVNDPEPAEPDVRMSLNYDYVVELYSNEIKVTR